jgi:hypothetical protein
MCTALSLKRGVNFNGLREHCFSSQLAQEGRARRGCCVGCSRSDQLVDAGVGVSAGWRLEGLHQAERQGPELDRRMQLVCPAGVPRYAVRVLLPDQEGLLLLYEQLLLLAGDTLHLGFELSGRIPVWVYVLQPDSGGLPASGWLDRLPDQRYARQRPQDGSWRVRQEEPRKRTGASLRGPCLIVEPSSPGWERWELRTGHRPARAGPALRGVRMPLAWPRVLEASA